LYLSFAIAVGSACGQPAAPETPGDDSFTPNQGGTNNNGGTGGGTGGTATGGTGTGGTATGGTGGGTGGSTTGGAGGVSGMPGVGGAMMAGRPGTTGGTGGSVATGGTGGSVATGGTGGSVATGGSSGTGSATGGSTSGAGGSGTGVSCDTTFKVGADGFVRMPTKDGGCWHGYAYGSGSKATTVSFCGDATATNFTKCMGMLSITGTLEESIEPDYAGYVLIGFSVNEAQGGGTKGTVTPKGASLVVTGTAAGGRVQLQAGTKYWCANFTSGTPIPYTTFNTACWDDSGDAYSTATPIDTVALQIPGGMAAAAYSITLTSVAEM
jgi:hypothetical protein